MAWKIALQVTALTGVGLGGWFTGILTERWKLRQTTCEYPCITENTEDLLCKIKRMPGLPICGTVSAASSPENKLSILENDLVPLETSPVPRKPSRVSQVNSSSSDFRFFLLREMWIIFRELR
jgi:hypothetical protein